MARVKGVPVERTRLNYSIPNDLLEMVDDYALKIGTSRTTVITFILRNFFESRKAVDACNSVLDLVNLTNINMDSVKHDLERKGTAQE